MWFLLGNPPIKDPIAIAGGAPNSPRLTEIADRRLAELEPE
jgi:hypothetical protein